METSSLQMDGNNEARPLFQNKLKMVNIKEEELTVMPEDIFDLHGLRENGIDLISIINDHQWHHFISLLNGPTYF